MDEKLDLAQSALVALIGAISIREHSLQEIDTLVSSESAHTWYVAPVSQSSLQDSAPDEVIGAFTVSGESPALDLPGVDPVGLGIVPLSVEPYQEFISNVTKQAVFEDFTELESPKALSGSVTEVVAADFEEVSSGPLIARETSEFRLLESTDFRPEELDFSNFYPFEGLLGQQLV